jgi:hypothetical protein
MRAINVSGLFNLCELIRNHPRLGMHLIRKQPKLIIDILNNRMRISIHDAEVPK